jgi:hypothetical protein
VWSEFQVVPEAAVTKEELLSKDGQIGRSIEFAVATSLSHDRPCTP